MAAREAGTTGGEALEPSRAADTAARGAQAARPRIEIRPVTLDDLPRVSELFGALHAYNATFDKAFELSDEWPAHLTEALTRALDQPDALWVLAWDRDEAVGLLIAETHLEPPIFRRRYWLELSALYVRPSHRRYGVARQLVDHLTAWAEARGLDAIQLYVSAANAGARDFYARQGFTVLQEIWRKRLAPDGATPPHGTG
jgi:ribosomal protein S18 acetylase RimI-like enzyme